VHLALVYGDVGSGQPALVRVHVEETLRDVVGIQSDSLGWPLRDAMARVTREGSGVIVILRSGENPRDLVSTIQALGSEKGEERETNQTEVLRTFGIGAQILRDLGVMRMRVLSAPKQMHGISGFGLEVVEYVDGG